MKLSRLDREPSFALLGPGFSAGRFLLLTALRPARDGEVQVVFAPFETPGAEALRWSGELAEVELEAEGDTPLPLRPELRVESYPGRVARIRQCIAAGDVYQVCYTVRVELGAVSGAELMRRLCRGELPRFAAWVRLPGGQELVSASPELLFEIEDRQATGNGARRVRCEPMKGTARPHAGAELELSAKDRAELAMITDLVRNDLTRVCEPRSVTVECERRVLALGYALQTVSDVSGRLSDGVSALDVLQALHPGGSVTGAPKPAALAMIRELESSPRGAYCGALGLVRGESARFSLLIRTAERGPAGWRFGVGSGIVFDSDPAKELEELHTKLEVLR